MKIKKDKYKSARGSHSKIVDISCAKCGAYVLTYQKDGVGNLRRLYADRIIKPEISGNAIHCPQCDVLLGTVMIYAAEQRCAFRVVHENISKTLVKGK